MTPTLYLGTIGEGVWRSRDGGETFARATRGLFLEADVRALVVDPADAAVVYAGTNCGLFRTSNAGDHWQRFPAAPFDPGDGWPGGVSVWSVAVCPDDPDTLLVGTCPAAVYRSRDNGQTWEELAGAGFAKPSDVLGHNRVTCLRFDDAGNLWAGAEIGGMRVSGDKGDTWAAPPGSGLSSPDIHDLLPLPGGILLASTNNDLNRSRDGGKTWRRLNIGEKWGQGYCRGMAQSGTTIFVGNGDTVPGTRGAAFLSRDNGETFAPAPLPAVPASTIWTWATHAADPAVVFCAAVLGGVYRSQDAGTTWTACRHTFGEIRALAWAPA